MQVHMTGSSLNIVFVGAGAAALSVVLTLLVLRFARGGGCGSGGRHQHHFFAAFEQSPNALFLAEASTLKILLANAAAQRSLGYALDELQKLTLSQLFTDDSGETQ